MNEGRDMMPIHGSAHVPLSGTRFVTVLIMVFHLSLSATSQRPSRGAWRAIGFLNGARTLKRPEKIRHARYFLDRWVTKEKCEIFGLPEGDLGDGSYGAAWANFPTKERLPFNQIAHVIQQIKERPYLRTHFISPWIPQYTLQHEGLTRKVVVAPCHGWIHILTYPDTKELVIHHFQRSADVPIGVVSNIVQYAAFGMMLAQVIGYTIKELVHTFSDAHIYHNQFDSVKEILAREPRSFPTLTLDSSIKNIFDFRPSHFTLSDYNPHPKMVIPTAI